MVDHRMADRMMAGCTTGRRMVGYRMGRMMAGCTTGRMMAGCSRMTMVARSLVVADTRSSTGCCQSNRSYMASYIGLGSFGHTLAPHME